MSTNIVSSGYVDDSRTIGADYMFDKMEVYGFGNFTTVNSGGSLCVKSDGRTNQATVNSWGGLYIFSGGYASSNTINGGVMHVYRGGIASNNHIDSDGSVLIYEGASAIENYFSYNGVAGVQSVYEQHEGPERCHTGRVWHRGRHVRQFRRVFVHCRKCERHLGLCQWDGDGPG